MWMGLIQSDEGLNKTKTDYFQARGNSGSRWSLNLNWNINSYFILTVFGLELQLWPFPESPVCWLSLLILNLPASEITWTILQSKSHTHSISFVWRTLTVMGNLFPYQENVLKGIGDSKNATCILYFLCFFGWMIWKHRCLIRSLLETLERMLSSF